VASSCEHGNEYSDSEKKKARNFMASGQPIEFLKSTALSAVTPYRRTYLVPMPFKEESRIDT